MRGPLTRPFGPTPPQRGEVNPGLRPGRRQDQEPKPTYMTPTPPPPVPPDPEQEALSRARKALKLVAANLPHLSGLCHAVRVKVTRKYPVAAVGASGLMLVNPR